MIATKKNQFASILIEKARNLSFSSTKEGFLKKKQQNDNKKSQKAENPNKNKSQPPP